jgi:hypothetical protein
MGDCRLRTSHRLVIRDFGFKIQEAYMASCLPFPFRDFIPELQGAHEGRPYVFRLARGFPATYNCAFRLMLPGLAVSALTGGEEEVHHGGTARQPRNQTWHGRPGRAHGRDARATRFA